MVDPGSLSSTVIVNRMWANSLMDRLPKIEPSEEIKGTRLSTKKLLSTGVKIRSVEEAF